MMIKFFDRLDIQVRQLFRSVKNLSGAKHLKLGLKAGLKQTKSDIGYFAGAPIWGLQWGAFALESTPNITYALSVASLPTVLALGYTIGLGFFRGIRTTDESVEALEGMTQKKWDMRKFLNVTEFFEKFPGYKEIGNNFAANDNLTYTNLADILNQISPESIESNKLLIARIVENSKGLSLEDCIKNASGLGDRTANLALLNLSAGSEPTSYDLESLKKLEANIESASPLKYSLIEEYLSQLGSSTYYLEYILKAKLKEKHAKIYHAFVQSADSLYRIDSCTDLADKLEGTSLYEHIIKPLSSKIDFDHLRDLSYKKSKILSNKDAEKVIIDLLKKSRRNDFGNSLETVYTIMDNSPIALAELATYGKKKRQSIISRLNPLFELFEEEAVEVIDRYRKYGYSIEQMLEHDIVRLKVGEYFGNIDISSDISNNDLMLIIKGYKHNKKVENSEVLFKSVLSGNSVWQYREDIGSAKWFRPENQDTLKRWKQGYINSTEGNESIKIDFEKLAKENYNEAIVHLNAAGIEESPWLNIYLHADMLIKEYQGRNEIIIRDAVEHLALVQSYNGKKEIMADEIIYSTGTFKDFLFIGYHPQNTCLAMYRSNSDCLLSMIGQPNTLPFLVYASHEGNMTAIGRSILRIEETDLIIDDIYGQSCDFVQEVSKFADQLGLNLLIPKKMYNNLSENDRKFADDNSLMREYNQGKTFGLYYSDSLGGRIEGDKPPIPSIVAA